MAYHPFRHLGLKFLSVGVALGLWFTIAGERTVERTLPAPLEYGDPPAELELVEFPPTTVDVRVRGTTGRLSQLAPSDVVATIDFSTAKEGSRDIRITPDDVRAPLGVEVIEVKPKTLKLRLEKTVSRTVPVEPLVEGEPAPGFVKGTATVEPAAVGVAGPESAMKRLTRAGTEPVSVAGRGTTVREPVAITLQDGSLRLTGPAKAVVTVPIQPRATDRLVLSVPVRARNAARGRSAQLAPSAVTVAVRGPKDVVDGLRPGALVAFVDLAGLGPGRHNPAVRVENVPNVEVLRTEPATVQVTIR